MDRIRPLEGRVRTYAWGSRTVLAGLRGLPTPSAEPEAELWFGAHPVAPSRIRSDGGWTDLRGWIARDPARSLGAEVVARFGPELPFLVKILAVERPLSLQVHPDAAQARAGFSRETRADIPVGAPERCFPDSRAKPELVCAIEPFLALAGFRPFEDIRAGLERCGVAGLLPELASFCRHPHPGSWRRAFGALLGLDAADAGRMLETVLRAAGGDAREEIHLVARLARHHPADVGALAPLFLNPVRLEPGQALYVPPGELHCYLGGVALEVMASSDNVLRAGLTSKPVRRRELGRVLTYDAYVPRPLVPLPSARGQGRFSVPVREFDLSRVDLGNGAGPVDLAVRAVEVVVCLEGRFHLGGARGGCELEAGGAAFVPAGVGGYRLDGEGRLYRVQVALGSDQVR